MICRECSDLYILIRQFGVRLWMSGSQDEFDTETDDVGTASSDSTDGY